MSIVRYTILMLFSLGSLLAPAQKIPGDYSEKWKKVDSLLQTEGLARSAIKEVNTIYESAKKEDNQVQVIKSLLYKFSINEQLSDESTFENIKTVEAEIRQSKEPARSLLHSIAGGMYWQYLQMNRWQFYDRTRAKSYQSDDIATWDITQIYERITSHFDKSLLQKKRLAEIELGIFDPIIIKGNSRHLRPTLYDVLAHRALDYYRNDERYITKPAYAFEINDSIAFAPAREFLNHTFKTNDTLSLHHKALELYQQLIQLHLNDASKSALIDVDISRLNFVHNFSTNPDKDDLYRNALEVIIKTYPSVSPIADAMYSLANLYWINGRSYDPVHNTTHRYYLVKAKEWCERAIASVDSSEGKSNAAHLLSDITRKELNVKIESVNIPGEPFRILINYKNAATSYFRIVPADIQLRQRIIRNQWHDTVWQALISTSPIVEFNYSLPATNDFQLHRVEAKINSLPAGEYALISSTENDFTLKEGSLAVNFFNVSAISYVRDKNRMYVLDRQDGSPLPGARVKVWMEKYNYRTEAIDLENTGTYTADRQGFLRLRLSEKSNQPVSYRFEINHNNNRLFLDDGISFSVPYQVEHAKEQAFLFTDRAIYRPGQTIYFKGIVIRRDDQNKHHIVPNRRSSIELYDANGNKVDSVVLHTNEFGSYNAKFTIPVNLLNGQFRIVDAATNSEAYFNVEEYKRPTFEVEVRQPRGMYRLDEEIEVEGSVRSYAGSNINNAAVVYRVVRMTVLPYWSRFGGNQKMIWPPYRQSETEITHGTTVTDASGKFKVSFKALPDKSIPREMKPVFHYYVTADVTDLSGETRVGATNVHVGYEALKLVIHVPEIIQKDTAANITVTSTNMNDSFESVNVKMSVKKLIHPTRIFRERYWEQPDQFIMERNDYYAEFPYDMYSDEKDKTTWKTAEEVFNSDLITKPGTSVAIPISELEPGWYLFEAATKDRYGIEVIDKQYVQLIENRLIGPFAQLSLAQAIRKGEFNILTNLENPHIIRDENDTTLKVVIVNHNRIYSEALHKLPQDLSTQLKIEYATFRNKTEPGNRETWKVKISGMKGEKVSSELLTSMYDASLDQFHMHSWQIPGYLWMDYDHSKWTGDQNFVAEESLQNFPDRTSPESFVKNYDRLIAPGAGEVYYVARGERSMKNAAAPVVMESQLSEIVKSEDAEANLDKDSVQSSAAKKYPLVQLRKNLNETAFFFPELRTDSIGNVEFSFNVPEALTSWKWMLLAHSKQLAFAYDVKEMITQKELMVQPNMPRFLREGDQLDFAARITNMSAAQVDAKAELHLIDPATGELIGEQFSLGSSEKNITIPARQGSPVKFSIKIPSGFLRPVMYRITASTGNNSDGEESLIPVITNRMLVTETMPLPITKTGTKKFRFNKLVYSRSSTTLKNHALTLEFTSNPAWYAVMALPYLAEEKSENAEQAFNRFYANAVASMLISNAPRLKMIIEKWKSEDTSAFMSNLEKNEELKSIVLQETPWVMQAKTEAQQKKNIAMLFDMVRMTSELKTSLAKLQEMQAPTGGFVWFRGAPEDRYMTQHIMTGIGRLIRMKAIPQSIINIVDPIKRNALTYLDHQLKRDYEEVQKQKRKTADGVITLIHIHYLYMRSFFGSNGVPNDIVPAYTYYRGIAKKSWAKQGTYGKGMLAVLLNRTGDKNLATKIIASLKEFSIVTEEMGRYWKDMSGGYLWHQAPIETQSLLIEAFNEISNDTTAVDEMRTWLLKNKQTNSWKTSKATADAVYALLLSGSNWIDEASEVQITLGDTVVSQEASQAGTGYFKTIIPGNSVKPAMGEVTVTLGSASNQPAWGALYWQYFEELDKITIAATPLKISKQLFVQRNTDRGPELLKMSDNNTLQVGDKVKVRIEIRADRNMEYVHLKDMRASGFEPVDVISGYKWRSGLGYYESTKDVSTNFYFGFLPKGVHIFEYDMFASQTGKFSNGITTIQCMYAPEFSSHSEGINVNIEDDDQN